MKKRLLSTFLAALMILSSSAVVMAAKKPVESTETEEALDIFGKIGGFDTQEQVDMTVAAGGVISLETSDKMSGRGCIKLKNSGSGNAAIDINEMKMYAGEVYDISLDVKSPTGTADIEFIFYFGDTGGWLTLYRGTNGIGPEWKTHKFSIGWSGKDSKGRESSGAGKIQIRYGQGNGPHEMLVDNVSMKPQGRVPNAKYNIPTPNKEAEALPEFEGTESYGIYPPKATDTKSFGDVAGHWAADVINTLATNDYIDGMDANNYAPNENLTRAQFVKMVTDSLKLTLPAYKSNYKDVKGDEWFAPYLQVATSLGLLDPALTFGGNFHPNRAITREEAATIAARYAVLKNAEKKSDAPSFSDAASISSWAQSGVKNAAEYGLISGYDTGKYLPKNLITRAEAAQILYRIAELSTKFSIYVDDETGNDKNDGSQAHPLKTVQAARDMVRSYNEHMKNDIYVRIKGEQKMSSALELGVEDSGSDGYTVVYTSWGDEKATLSAGKEYKGFTLHDPEKNIYKVFVGQGKKYRQAWFNGVRGILARTISGLAPDCKWQEYKKNYISSDRWLLDLTQEELHEIEMWYLNNFQICFAKIDNVVEQEDGRVIINPMAPGWASALNIIIRWPNQPQEFPAHLQNSYRFLSQPGEFYISSTDGYLYYIPRAGEDMSTMEVTLPVSQEIVTIKGVNEKTPVHNIRFDNLTIAENDWHELNNATGIWVRQNMAKINFGNGLIDVPSAFEVFYGWYVDITNCDVTRLGTKGITYHEGAKYCKVVGNEVYDTAANGIIVGDTYIAEVNPEPLFYTEGCSVDNNYVHDIGQDWQIAAAVTMGYAKDMTYNHNTITNVPYSGLSLGWGWDLNAKTGSYMTNYEAAYNFINETSNGELFDGASIYTLGAQNLPKEKIQSFIHHNYMKNNRNAYGFIYPDQGTLSTHWYQNIVDTSDVIWEFSHLSTMKTVPTEDIYYFMTHTPVITNNIIEETYSTTEKGRNLAPDNVYGDVYVYPDANWPEEARQTIAQTGPVPEYRDNFDFTGPKYFVAKQREYIIDKGKSMQLDIRIEGLDNEKYPLSAGKVSYEISDPEAITIDENGVATSTGKFSQVWILATAEINGIFSTRKLFINAGDEIDHIDIGVDELNMIPGYDANLPIKVFSTSGIDFGAPDEVTITSSDPSVVTVDSEKYMASSLKEGSATISIVAKKDGKTFTKEVPVTVIPFPSNQDAVNLPYTSMAIGSSVWKGQAEEKMGKVTVQGAPAYYTSTPVDKLIAFDMEISEGNSWPSFMLCAGDNMISGTREQTAYLIGFMDGFIEVQRFVKGVRTYFIGDEVELHPLVGPGIPNINNSIYSYGEGKPISVVVGALAGENGGTRLVLNINGKNLLDYTDNDANAIPYNGSFGVYTQGNGSFTFSPFTGRTN